MNPNSRLWLCKTNLENDYNNTLTFSSKNTQRNYFIGDPSDPTSHGTSTKMYSDYTYLRVENAVKVDDFIENIDTNNYAVILNNNKYYYYFITSMDYIDDSTTKIHIELDVMQTYFFDITYNNTFVEREHVTDDTVGKHTIPEGLETGEYINGDVYYLSDEDNFVNNIVFQVVYMSSDIDDTLYTVYGGIFSGCLYMVMDYTNAVKFIKFMDQRGKRDYIINIFMYYGNITDNTSYTIVTGSTLGTITYKVVDDSDWSKFDYDLVLITNKPTSLGTYTPRNKKLLTDKYQYLLVNNQGGSTKQYSIEQFTTTNVKFCRYSVPTVGGSMVYFPYNYKYDGGVNSSVINYNEGFVGAKFPTCCWTSDGYTNWLTQSGVNEKEEYNQKSNFWSGMAGVGMFGVGLFSGNLPLIGLGLGKAGESIVDEQNIKREAMDEREAHAVSALELKGFANAGDVMYGINKCMPKFTVMHIKEEYAKIIDKYFDQYGYKVNILKTPSIHTRRYWNYIKTKGCNFVGNIPQEYMERIKKIFDSGITFWHDPSKMFDYSQTNSVLS